MRSKIVLLARVPDGRGGFPFIKIETCKKGKLTRPTPPKNATAFYLRYSENGKRRVEAVGQNIDQAFTAFCNKEVQREYLKRGMDVPAFAETDRLTIADAVKKFVAHNAAKGRAKSTQEAYQRTAEEFRDHCNRAFFQDVSADTILEYMAWTRATIATRASGDRDGMVVSRLQNLSALWKCVNGKRGTFPLPWADWPKVAEKPVKTFSNEDVAKLLSFATIEEADLIEFSLSTGFRSGELCHVRYADIDFARGFVNVYNRPEWKTKNGKSREANITLPESVVVRIRERRARHGITEDSALIFPNAKGKVQSGSRVVEQLRRVALRAGLPNAFPPGTGNHRFRKTFVTRIAKKYSATTARKLAGQNNLKTTERYLDSELVTQDGVNDIHEGYANVEK